MEVRGISRILAIMGMEKNLAIWRTVKKAKLLNGFDIGELNGIEEMERPIYWPKIPQLIREKSK